MHRIVNGLSCTIDHAEIRRWVDERGGLPAVAIVKNYDVPFIDFGLDVPLTRRVQWDEWLRLFEEQRYAFVCKETRVDGRASQYCQLMPRDSKQLSDTDCFEERKTAA